MSIVSIDGMHVMVFYQSVEIVLYPHDICKRNIRYSEMNLVFISFVKCSLHICFRCKLLFFYIVRYHILRIKLQMPYVFYVIFIELYEKLRVLV